METILCPTIWYDATGDSILAETEWDFKDGVLVGVRFKKELRKFRD